MTRSCNVHAKESPPDMLQTNLQSKCGKDLMTLYLGKKTIPGHEHTQEILARLMHSIRQDVVKIRSHNDTSLHHLENPHDYL